MIRNIDEFIDVLDSARRRTMRYVHSTPDNLLNWKPNENKFTTRELLIHIGSVQVMFTNIFVIREWKYTGHGNDKGETLNDIISYLDQCHLNFIHELKKIDDDILTLKFPTLHGYNVSGWRLLMALLEHEIHHRGQLSTYLQMNQIDPPQIFGLKIEDV